MKSSKAVVILFVILSTFALQSRSSVQAQSVVEFDTNFGDIVIQLFDTSAPISVNNFLGYVTRGDYDGTIFHRSVLSPGSLSIVQGGGFDTNFNATPTLPPILNEFGASNTRGTIAYARTPALNSATNQFFFNTEDNSSNLDNQSGGFTVFGQVTSGLDIIDQINQLDVVNAGAPFGDLPVTDLNAVLAANAVTADDVVIINSATVTFAIPEPTSAVVLALGGILGATRRRRTR